MSFQGRGTIRLITCRRIYRRPKQVTRNSRKNNLRWGCKGVRLQLEVNRQKQLYHGTQVRPSTSDLDVDTNKNKPNLNSRYTCMFGGGKGTLWKSKRTRPKTSTINSIRQRPYKGRAAYICEGVQAGTHSEHQGREQSDTSEHSKKD